MTSLLKRFEQYMMAATFAEAGEHQTAMEMLTDQDRVQKTRSRPDESGDSAAASGIAGAFGG